MSDSKFIASTRGSQLLDLVDQLSDLSPADRIKRLEESALTPQERREVEKWLNAAEESTQFLDNGPTVIRNVLASDPTLVRGGGDEVRLTDDAKLPAAPAIPDYQIEGLLGRGAMGTVWKARDTRLQRNIAIKVMTAAGPATGEAAARFLREARAAARLNHPNAVTIHQVIEHEGQILIVMELLDGMSLGETLAEHGAIPWPQAVRAMRDAAAGLEAAHEVGLIHRDIKPSNLMRTAKGIVKVVDFGVARNEEATLMTREGALIGTPAYMSPEQCEGREADARSDLYSLGCSFFHLMSGRLPFKGDSAPSVMYQHCHAPPPVLKELVAEAPQELSDVLRRCMAKVPGDRYGSAGELIIDLEMLSPVSATATTMIRQPVGNVTAQPRQISAGRGRAKLLWIVGVLAGVSAGAVIAWNRLRPASAPALHAAPLASSQPVENPPPAAAGNVIEVQAMSVLHKRSVSAGSVKNVLAPVNQPVKLNTASSPSATTLPATNPNRASAETSFLVSQTAAGRYDIETSVHVQGAAVAGETSNAEASINTLSGYGAVPGQFVFRVVDAPVTLNFKVVREHNGMRNRESNPFGRDDVTLNKVGAMTEGLKELGYWGIAWENPIHPFRSPDAGSMILQPGTYCLVINLSCAGGSTNVNPYTNSAYITMSLRFTR